MADNMDYTHFPWADNYTDNDSIRTLENIKEVLYEGSYLFYELEDSTIEVPLFIEAGEVDPGTYTKHISPLFYRNVIDEEDNWYLLDIITEEVPFYHMEPNVSITEDDILLSATRDIGINNVPSPLQDNDFYNSWFRDSIGYVKNSMILDIYNKMRYPYIFENQYLNARILNRLANELVKTIDNTEARLAFKATDEENNEAYNEDYRFYGHEVGCLDYLEDIVGKKVNSIYSFIDFNPEYSGFLSDWSESMYKSGKLTYEESTEESLVYKLQEIRSELLRRKFAGTYSLYMILLNSMGKTGSYLGVLSSGDANAEPRPYYDENGDIIGFIKSFNDTRPLRIPNLPGIFSDYSANLDLMNPVQTYHEKPDESDKIPLGTIIPLFYSSRNVNNINGDFYGTSLGYRSEVFYKSLDPNYDDIGYVNPQYILEYVPVTIPQGDGTSAEKYRSAFYRDSTNTVYWDSMPGILNQNSVYTEVDTLDTIVEETSGSESYLRYRTLDEIMSFTDKNGDTYESYGILDHEKDKIDLSAIYGSVLDITADEILYHRNVLQKEGNYEFVTYPIADGNGLCLMDTSWLNYMEYYSKQKSKVNEDITFGVQISTYIEVNDNLNVPHEYFTISVSGDNSYIYLYHNLLNYKAESFKVTSITKTLMTKIRVRHDGPVGFYVDGKLSSEYKEFEKFTKFNVGLIPFTYRGLKESQIEDMKLGASGTSWNDDIELLGLSEAYFYFSDYDIPNYEFDRYIDDSINDRSEDEKSLIPYDMKKIVSLDYTNETKAVYFVVKRIENGVTRYVWSDPIRVFSEDVISVGDDFKPDWHGLVYYLNPYFNFTKESASPLRHKKAIKAHCLDTHSNDYNPILEEEDSPSESTGLCNLARMRRLDYLCADMGTSNLEWQKQGYKGLFLQKSYVNDNTNGNTILIGDNRSADDYEVYYEKIVTYDGISGIPTPYDTTILYAIPNSEYPGAIDYYKAIEEAVNNDIILVLKRVQGFDPKDRLSEVYKENYSIPSLWMKEKISGTQEESSDLYNGGSFYTSLDLVSIGNGISWTGNNGFTICMDISFDKSASCVLFSQGNILLKYENSKFLFCGCEISSEISVNKNYRISASVLNDGTSYLIVNNKDTSSSTQYDLTDSSMKLFRGFHGKIYDFRLYNDGKELNNLKLLNAGMLREIYSYSPSTYKLAHSIYVDNSLIRTVDNSNSETSSLYGIKKIDTLRVFNRSVWDSIMLDMYPVSSMEADENSPQYYEYYKNPIDDHDIYMIYENEVYMKDCVEQSLMEDFEVFNGKAVNAYTTLLHNNKEYHLSDEDHITAVLALIQPVSCKDERINTMSFLSLLNGGLVSPVNGNITIPMKSDSSDDYFKYSADLDINFDLPVENSFSWFLSRGTNIGLKYHSSIKDTLVIPESPNIRGSEFNYILIPLYVPEQINPGVYLDKFYIRNFSLSRTLSSFLRATSYYNEIRIPVPTDISDPGYVPVNGEKGRGIVETAFNNNWGTIYVYKETQEVIDGQTVTVTDLVPVTESSDTFDETKVYYRWDEDRKSHYYYNKWDAIRTLKEGEYIFTCKYPLKILPFTDPDFSNGNKDYNTLYGTLRFKIEVSGAPKEMTTEEISKYNITKGTIPDELRSTNIKNTLKQSSNRVNPEDNMTFPHREMFIRLYAYDVAGNGIAGYMNGDTEDYSMEWNLIGSNIRDEAFTTSYVPAGNDFDSFKTYYRRVTEPEVHYKKVDNPLAENIGTYYVVESEVPKDGISYLSKENLDDGLVITRQCPLFLMNNYVESFYVKHFDRSKPSSITDNSEDDDMIDPIVIEDDIFSNSENLMSNSDNGLNKLTLIGGKTYKILFDFTPRVTEFRYVKGTSDIDILSNLVVANSSGYTYTETGEIEELDSQINNHTYGYKWSSQGWLSTDSGLGNPYSSESSENLLMDKCLTIPESYQIRYLDDFKIPSKDADGNEIWIDPYDAGITYHYRFNKLIPYYAYDINDSLVNTSIIESDLIKYHYNKINPDSLVNDFKSHTYGLIGGLSFIEPHITGRNPKKSIIIKTSAECLPDESSERISTESLYDFCSYHTPSWRVPFINNTVPLRTASKSNTLISDSLNPGKNWIFDLSDLLYKSVNKAQDPSYVGVFIREYTNNAHVRMKYSPKTNISIDAVYEVELSICCPQGMEVGPSRGTDTIEAHFYDSKNKVFTCTLYPEKDSSEQIIKDADGWVIYKGFTSDAVKADSVEFDVCVTRGAGSVQIQTGENQYEDQPLDDYIKFKNAKAFYYEAKSYKLGLSEAYDGTSSYDKAMYVASHTVPVFTRTEKNDTTSVEIFVPILFKPEVVSANGSYRPIPGIYRASSFISSCASEDADPYSRIRKLKTPWIRRLNFYYQGDQRRLDFHKYGIRKNSLGISEYREIYSDVKDIYSIEDGSEFSAIAVTLSENKESFDIRFTGGVKMNLAEDGTIKLFNNNLRVYSDDAVSLVNERMSYTYNCFDLNRYSQGLDSYVGVTNIQLLNRDFTGNKGLYDNREIIYEIEYLPIIYNELKNHISFNIMLNHVNN